MIVSSGGNERTCDRCGTTTQVIYLRANRNYCQSCDRELHPSHLEASERGDGNYFVMVEGVKGFEFAPDCGYFLPRTKAEQHARELAATHKVVMVLGGDARIYHPDENAWEVHSRYAIQRHGYFGQLLDELEGEQKPTPGLRFTHIGSGVDPWKVIACPGCGSRRFESVEGAAVYCADCGIQFCVRHTAGDPGLVVDAFDRHADRTRQRRRLWVGGVYSVLKTGDDDPHWIVVGDDPRLPHEFSEAGIDNHRIGNGAMRLDHVWANWRMEIGPEYRPIYRTATPYNTGYGNHVFICGDCAARLGVRSYNPSDTESDPRDRYDCHSDPPKIGGNPRCYECGYQAPGFTKHYSDEPLPYKPFGPLRSEVEATRKAKENANG